MNRRHIFIIIAVVIVIFTFFNPFGSLSDLQRKVERPAVEEAQVEILKTYVLDNYKTPQEYIIDAFGEHDIIFLGEYWHIKQNLDFVQSLIPLLYAQGITDLGVEFALYEDQALIDQLITDSRYDEQVARRILFNFLVVWGYQEYADLFKTVWQFNQSLPAGSQPFRVTGLSVRQNFKIIQTIQDTTDPEVLKKVYANGTPDYFFADVVQREFIAKNKKALLFSHIHTAFTRFRYQEYRDRKSEQGFTENLKAGQLLYAAIGERVMNVMIHAPFPNEKNYTGIGYPVNGAIDAVIEALPREKIRCGFTTADSPFGSLGIESTTYTIGYDKLTLADFCDSYVILAPLRELVPVTPITGFINPENIEEAKSNFFGPKDQKVSMKQFNTFIKEDTDNLWQLLRQFE